MRSRWLFSSLVLLMVADGPARAEPPSTIIVDIENLRIEQGWELCSLYSSAEGFPYDLSKAVQHARVPIHDGAAVCEFPGAKPGMYAIAVMRDENGNGIPAKDFLGMPKSGIGASHDAHAFLGPPKFEDARFEYKGSTLRMTIKMAYRTSR